MELKTEGKRLVTILLVCLLLLPFGAMVVAAQTPDAGAVIQAAYAAVAEKDIETAMSYVADDMVLTLIPPPLGMDGVFVGKEAVRDWWEVLAADNGRAEFSDVMVSGSRVTWRAKWYADTFDALGVGPAEFEGVGVAQNGLLQSATWIFTEAFLARFEQANQLAANEALAHRYLEEMWDNGDMEVADEILADEFVDHYPLFGNAPDKAGLMADATSFYEVGAKTRIEELIVTEDTIIIRGTVLMPDANGDLQEALEAAIFLSVADGQIIERRIAIFGLQPPPPPGANAAPADTAVEGTYAISGPPLERMTTPSGDGCLVNVVLPYEFSGAITGTAEVHLAVLGQGPCEEMGPGLFDETVAAKGTFTGTVDDKAGTFEFLYGFQGQARQPFNGFIQIIPNSGTDELQGILGDFTATGDPLNGEPFVYAGNYAWTE